VISGAVHVTPTVCPERLDRVARFAQGWSNRPFLLVGASSNRAGNVTSALFEAQPDAREIQVERVKFLRYGEARGDYGQVVATLNVSDPHGR
jgi:hypothetical protein